MEISIAATIVILFTFTRFDVRLKDQLETMKRQKFQMTR